MWVNARPHPGPLPQERENQLQSAGVASAPWNFVGQPLLFPLPEGEGQGGEPCSLNSPNSPCSTKTLPFSSRIIGFFVSGFHDHALRNQSCGRRWIVAA